MCTGRDDSVAGIGVGKARLRGQDPITHARMIERAVTLPKTTAAFRNAPIASLLLSGDADGMYRGQNNCRLVGLSWLDAFSPFGIVGRTRGGLPVFRRLPGDHARKESWQGI